MKLKIWERILLDVKKGESNPTIVKVPGAIEYGLLSLQSGSEAGSSVSHRTHSITVPLLAIMLCSVKLL